MEVEQLKAEQLKAEQLKAGQLNTEAFVKLNNPKKEILIKPPEVQEELPKANLTKILGASDENTLKFQIRRNNKLKKFYSNSLKAQNEVPPSLQERIQKVDQIQFSGTANANGGSNSKNGKVPIPDLEFILLKVLNNAIKEV